MQQYRADMEMIIYIVAQTEHVGYSITLAYYIVPLLCMRCSAIYAHIGTSICGLAS